MDHPFSLSGKTALVTGAYRGLGYAIARGLAQAGASVVINGRNKESLDAALASLRAEGLDADLRVFDVTDREAIDVAVRSIDGDFGGVAAKHGFIEQRRANYHGEELIVFIRPSRPGPASRASS